LILVKLDGKFSLYLKVKYLSLDSVLYGTQHISPLCDAAMHKDIALPKGIILIIKFKLKI